MVLQAILTFSNRYSYLRMCLAAYKEATRYHHDIELKIYDHRSDKQYPEILKEFQKNIVEINDVPIDDQHGFGRIYARIITDRFNEIDEDYLFLLESDGILHPLAFNRVKEMIRDLPDMGMGTIFNTEEHPEVDANIESNNRYVYKSLSGLFCSIIRRDPWMAIHEKLINEGECGVIFSSYIDRHPKYNLYATYNSYVEHIGFEGINLRRTKKNTTLEVDRARRFYNE